MVLSKLLDEELSVVVPNWMVTPNAGGELEITASMNAALEGVKISVAANACTTRGEVCLISVIGEAISGVVIEAELDGPRCADAQGGGKG